MGGSSRRRGRTHTLSNAVAVVAWGLMATACASSSASYQEAAMQASERGDQKSAVDLGKKEVARFASSDQCSRATNTNCGTLALAYGTLAGYQILDGDSRGGELSFINAKGALSLTDPEIRASATGIVYRDVSEAFWKVGDKDRAVAVFKEGRSAGADKWLYMSSAARAAEPPPAQPPSDQLPSDRPPADQPRSDQLKQDQQPVQQQPLQPSPLRPRSSQQTTNSR